jgi:hypothetical protein
MKLLQQLNTVILVLFGSLTGQVSGIRGNYRVVCLPRHIWQLTDLCGKWCSKTVLLKQVYNISSVFAAADKLAAIVLKRTWIRVGCGSILRARKWA